MPRTLICHGCEERLTKAFNAMRLHANAMNTAIQLARNGPTEEQEKDFTILLVATFKDAQSAWHAYREHLVEHGLLPGVSSAQDVA